MQTSKIYVPIITTHLILIKTNSFTHSSMQNYRSHCVLLRRLLLFSLSFFRLMILDLNEVSLYRRGILRHWESLEGESVLRNRKKVFINKMGGETEVIQRVIQASHGLEETIRVSIRLRPLNEKELAKNDSSDWECINNNSVTFRSTLPERSMYPQSYTFGKQTNLWNLTFFFSFLFCF